MASKNRTQPLASDEMARVGVEWARQNARILVLGISVVLGTLLAIFLYVRSAEIREVRASERFEDAQRLAMTGQEEEGVRALYEVAKRYGNTSSGALAALRLARMSLEQRRFDEAISVLQNARKEANMKVFGASIHGLLGAAYSDSGLSAAAARAYLDAAEATRSDREREQLRLQAAESYARGNEKAEAIRILEGLATATSSDVRDWAVIRLGELRAEPAKGGATG